MNTQTFSRFGRVIRSLGVALTLTTLPVFATVLDNFNAASRSGWEDKNPAGLPLPGGSQSGGQFTFDLPAIGQPFFHSSTKTSETFELKEGRTVEFRVDMVSGRGIDSFAILAFVPQNPGPNSLQGYGLAKSESDILITKGINKYFFNENVNPAVKNENVTLVLNLKAKGGSVYITGQVLDKDNGNKVIWEKSYVDTQAADVLADGTDDPPAPFINQVGNFVLYLYGDGGKDPAGYQVVYDNAETFVNETTVLDDFNAPARSGWEDKNPAGLPLPGGSQSDGQFTFDLPAIGQPFFHSSTKLTKSYTLTEGTRHEFAVDMVSGRGIDSFAILAFVPQSPGPNSLQGYGFAKSESDILLTKGINKYFFNENVNPAVKNNNVRLVLTLTVQNGNVTIRGRVLDHDANDAVIFDKTFVDSPAADVLADGTDDPPAPFIGVSGNVVLYLYGDGGKDPAGYQVVYDNLDVSAPPAAANLPPVISEISPGESSNFLPANTQLTFKISDDAAIADAGVKVVLNGVTYTTANGLSLGAAGANRTATLGGFSPNTSYFGNISVTDAGGLDRSAIVAFDTFAEPDVTVVEVEDYNFESGLFFNNPVRFEEATGPLDNSYNDRVGTSDVDFSDSRTSASAADSPFRPQDPVRMAHTLDRERAKYPKSGVVYDYDVGDLATGDWMNYTHEFAPATYEIYLREAIVNIVQGDSALDQVTGDETQPGQTIKALGSFQGKNSGYTFRNVALTDGAGLNKIKVRLNGKATFRLRTVTPDNDSGQRLLNYLLFVPVSDAGLQRAAIVSLAPAADSTTATTEPKIAVFIQNRDTTVVKGGVQLTVNGAAVTPVITQTDEGVDVNYNLATLPANGALNTARLVFEDNLGFKQTNDWSFTITYKEIDPAFRTSGVGDVRGIKVHSTQSTDAGPNSLERAEDQLAANSQVAKNLDVVDMIQALNLSKNAISGGGDGYFDGDLIIPGQTEDTGADNFAIEATGWMELSAGITRFGVQADDGYKLAFAPFPNASTLPLAFHNGGPADETTDVVVHEPGLYAYRMVWYNRGGGAHVELFTVDRTSGVRTLINADGGVKSYSTVTLVAPTVTLESSASVASGYAVEAGATVNTTAKTVTIPANGQTRFYRLKGPAGLRLTNIAISGANLVLSYQ